jgi:hypothetical protein
VFFFWILIYIEKEGNMKISCNRVSKVFWLPGFLGFLVEVFAEFLLGIFVGFLPGIFVYHLFRDFCGVFGRWEFLVYTWLLNKIYFFDKERSSKDKRKGTVQYKVLYYTF